jgi:hypothetical protein
MGNTLFSSRGTNKQPEEQTNKQDVLAIFSSTKVIQIQILTMEANSIFQDVIKFIEKSELNYVMKKTPYSANISLKSSFIKRFGNEDFKKSVGEDKTVMVDLKAENARLQERLEFLELELKETKQLATRVKEAESEKERFENLYEAGKRKEMILKRKS